MQLNLQRKRNHKGRCIVQALILILVMSLTMISPFSNLADTNSTGFELGHSGPILNHLQSFASYDSSSPGRHSNSSLTIEDPSDPYPIVVIPYNGSGVDPYYNIPSDGTNLWDHDPTMPEWMKAYFNWHKWRRQTWDPDQWADDRWMIMQCLSSQDKRKCGGTADRLKPLPTLLRLAYEHRRLLLIRWTRPATLESFLVPPVGGVDWRVPEWMIDILEEESNGRRFVPSKIILKYAATNLTLMRTRYQSTTAGSDLYNSRIDQHKEQDFNQVFAKVWSVFFRPSVEVEQRIQSELTRMDLIPGNYVAAHLRALYAIEDRPMHQIQQWTHNAINCASELRPGSPIFFASDSANASLIATAYSKSKNARLETHVPNPNPPLHLDREKDWQNRQPSDFYDTFVDLYLLSLAGCVTFNKGGYGHWGLLIGGNLDCKINQATRANGRPKRICQWHKAPPEEIPGHFDAANMQLFPDAMP